VSTGKPTEFSLFLSKRESLFFSLETGRVGFFGTNKLMVLLLPTQNGERPQ